ncbi:MAG TPA: tRNA dihydrouridine(20/20a) synthase DusA [Rhodospirillaceae bacterium]|nr:tRNA dihydrouridine(20/20a) synthase DusA [Rhodospirillaceae bacterium]
MSNMHFHRIAIAPMMDWTDRHCRFFLRQLSRHVLLHTEMVTTGAIIHGDRERLLGYHPEEHPLALQLGGSDTQELAECARIAANLGYGEVNLNVGCPSDRVQAGRFGVCLMKEPDLVARCVAAMMEAVDIPISVKTRIGVDDQPEGPALETFVEAVSNVGCERFTIHARKAWLKGLSPKENRDVPPLNYSVVYELKEKFPDLSIAINGGLADCDAADEHLEHVDGVMFGRAAYQNCYILSEVDRRFYDVPEPVRSRHQIARAMIPYIERAIEEGTALVAVTRHMLGLFQGVPGARLWRRSLSEKARAPDAGGALIEETLSQLPEPQPEIAA